MFKEDMSQIYHLLHLTGHWFKLKKHNRVESIYAGFQTLRLVYMVVGWPLSLWAIGEAGIKESLGQTLVFSIIAFILITQAIYAFFNQDWTAKSLLHFQSFYQTRSPSSQERLTFEKEARTLWDFSRFYNFSILFFATCHLILPIVGDTLYAYFDSDNLPFRVPMAMSGFLAPHTPRSLRYYSITFLGLTWSVICMVNHVGFYSTMFLLTALTGLELKLLRLSLSGPLDSKNLETTGLKIAIERHQRIMRLYHDVRDFYGFPSACQNLVGSFCICLNLYTLSIKMKEEISFFLMTNVILIFITSLFLFTACFFGEYLKEQGEALYATIMGLPWYDFSPKTRRSLNFFLMNARQPVEINYKGMTPLGFVTFMQIMNTSYSYFMVLKTMA